MATTSPAKHRVDVDVDALIVQAARARLGIIHKEELGRTGAARTFMADVARSILVNWTPENQPAPDIEVVQTGPRKGSRLGGGRASTGERAPKMPIRFSVTEDIYRRQSRAMRRNLTTVTRVLEQGLEEFARTGKY